MNDQERYWQTVNDERQDRLDRLWKHADEVPQESAEDRACRLYHERQDRIAEDTYPGPGGA